MTDFVRLSAIATATNVNPATAKRWLLKSKIEFFRSPGGLVLLKQEEANKLIEMLKPVQEITKNNIKIKRKKGV